MLCFSALFLVTGTWANNQDLVKFKNTIIKQRKILKKPTYVLNNAILKQIAISIRKKRGNLAFISVRSDYHRNRIKGTRIEYNSKKSSKRIISTRKKTRRNFGISNTVDKKERINQIKKAIAGLEDKIACEGYMEQMVIKERGHYDEDFDLLPSFEWNADRVRFISPDTLKKKWRARKKRLKAKLRSLR